MRKWFIALFILILLLGGAGVGAYLYVSPGQELDLAYEEVPLRDRALDMAKRLSPELVLTEEDVNNLAKSQLASNPFYMKNVELTGVNFRLANGRLIADANIKAFGRVPVGMELTYDVVWNDPNLVATVTEARIRDIKLPADSFNEVVIPLGAELPSALKVQEVRIGEDRATIEFKLPSPSDLRSLF
ncbi:hypothetical protein [Cohnella thailandensis]|uniref:DUF2140 family protein n=1 Tax=Cohnella thailandensis TaxID=557557 RepID=A0A841T1C2_9BACL|nr:hypothetical protein [Cohnella thailandensis]MBB6637342.1 hypothetical protein [Cohnella thailandensis]MBP1976670.1 hypothetical protein [Cohnella thailandensis]